MSYCPDCGFALEPPLFEGRLQGRCPSCRRIHFPNPKLVAGVIVSKDDQVALGKRGAPPGIGLWSFAVGYVNQGEVVEEAARREVKEELGIDVHLTRLVGIYSEPQQPVVLVVYAGIVLGGALTPGSDMQEADWFSPDQLPPLAFERDRRIFQEWRLHAPAFRRGGKRTPNSF